MVVSNAEDQHISAHVVFMSANVPRDRSDFDILANRKLRFGTPLIVLWLGVEQVEGTATKVFEICHKKHDLRTHHPRYINAQSLTYFEPGASQTICDDLIFGAIGEAYCVAEMIHLRAAVRVFRQNPPSTPLSRNGAKNSLDAFAVVIGRNEQIPLLHAEGEVLRKPRMLRQIAYRLVRLSESEIAEIRYPLSEWLRDVAEPLIAACPRLFGDIWDRIIVALAANPPPEKFRRSDASWVEEGLNQPPGRLVDALFKDPARHELKSGDGLGDLWRARLDQLLALPGSLRQQALAIIAARLNWLFEIDPDWTLENLIPAATAEGADAHAFWGGYFWPARVPQGPLYSHLKPAFVALARGGLESREQKNKLAGMLLAGWKGAPRANDEAYRISDIELREILIHADDELRSQTLGYLIRWPGDPDSGWGECVIPFLRDVWPRQLAVRTPRTSARLVDLAVSNPDRFAAVAELVLPWLTTVESGGFLRFAINDADQVLINEHPATVVDILWAVLPADPNQWPYETDKILLALEATEARNDERLAELRRRHRLR